MVHQITGRLIVKEKEEVFGANNFRVRKFVIEEQGQYSNYAQFQLTQNNCDMLNGYKKDEDIKVSFNVQGRKYEKKDGTGSGYFTSLVAWKIERVAQEQYNAPVQEQAPVQAPVQAPETDDLPF